VESFRHFQDRMVVEEEQTQTDGYELSPAQLHSGLWTPRVTGSITFISSLCMLLMAWKRRDLLFHRLVLVISINQVVYSLFKIYGAAAIPSEDINAIGNYGTIATCTTQGFFIYVCTICSYFYYASFSIYSFVGVLSNFEKEKYMWVEKYIHTIIPLYPLITAFVILSKQAFNKSDDGVCRSTNAPLGCDDEGGVPCERGSFNHRIYFKLVYGAIALFFPTIVMVVLYVKVAQQQSQIYIRANAVAQQATIYLLALYLGLLPQFAMMIMSLRGYDNIPFSADVFAEITYELFAVWIMLIYAYFTFDRFGSSGNNKNNDNDNDNDTGNTTIENRFDTVTATTKKNSNNLESIFGPEGITGNSSKAPTMVAAPTPAPVTEQPKYSFNIFDGTNASGAFADFIHDGDSDDEKVDNAMTDRWAAIQDHT